jgi:hypothetical protein
MNRRVDDTRFSRACILSSVSDSKCVSVCFACEWVAAGIG